MTKPAKRSTATGRRKAPRGGKVNEPRHAMQRPDFGAPIDKFLARQPPHLRAITEALRELLEETVPAATGSLKWGMPCYTVAGRMFCSIGGHKAHVNLVLMGPAEAFEDPEGRLEGASPRGRHLRLTSLDDLPRAAVRRWLRVAAGYAKGESV